MSFVVLMTCCLLWIAGLRSCRSAWDTIWERDWMELTWAVCRTVLLIFLAIVAGSAHAHWNGMQSFDVAGPCMTAQLVA